MCRFGAVVADGEKFRIDPARCEGCKVCVAFCPEEAIDFPSRHCGAWYVSDTRFGPMVHAQLFPGQENSGRLVSVLKKEARQLAEAGGHDLILCDGSPGIGCPVISSLFQATLAVVVTEPTPSCVHDLERVVALCDHFRYEEPGSKGYRSSAPAFVLIETPDLGRSSKTHDIWLPTAGLSYRISDMFQPCASYGRSHIRPYSYVPLINLYNQYRNRFNLAGVTLQELFDGYDIETSDNFELGLRITHERFDVTPAFFYSKHDNLLTTVTDPRVTVGTPLAPVNYQQNVGKATGYGLEVEGNFYFTPELTFFINPTYTHLTYDKDLTFSGATMKTRGEQIVDVPEWMVKTGVVWRWQDFEVIPTVRYLGEKYGDAEHKEKIDDYVVADLSLNYVNRDVSFAEGLGLSLNLYNLFNTGYVSMISASDDTREGGASYFEGAPFTAVFSVGVEF
jgi:outer membrane receptor protein involved in Fe transport